MLFWVLCAGMTAAVLYGLTLPLSAARKRADQGTSADLEFYRNHLKEIEADCARGLLSAEEAEAARVEASRRLLKASGSSSQEVSSETGRQRMVVFAATALCVPLAALALYLSLGSPGIPGQPTSERSSARFENASVGALIAQVEERLRTHPEDGQGWDVIAPVYLRLNRFEDSAQAFQRTIRILGESPRRLVGFGEATVLARGGLVVEEARRAFEQALKLQPGLHTPRMWLAMAKEQDGNRDGALQDYRALLSDGPADAPWRSAVQERIEVLEGEPAADAEKGPRADDVAEAEKLTPAQRNEMIGRMVEGLASRLKADGKDLPGWQRLVRSYVVLGRKEDAVAALSQAREVFAGDAASLAALSELARTLGLESS